ncbi:hypothetical protein REB14_15535 [Chryseobacterium sp. ES2]|uniref:Uncharacterized protein n=1 Tax=Chryseobacterium metallicongregator TaxID=3073042 RepID=A0ABU1E7K9_9FLAO|nr:hypothetical protein [Chryseobacterium sp. ES2]MDR4953590.1 hypothetical protein [Chryseobacterium sp. ES2]
MKENKRSEDQPFCFQKEIQMFTYQKIPGLQMLKGVLPMRVSPIEVVFLVMRM